MKQEQPQPMTLGEQINLLVGLGGIGAFPSEVFLRRPGTFGDRFVTGVRAIGVLVMFMFIAEFKDPIAFPALYATAGMLAIHRLVPRRCPEETHSLYDGTPWLPGPERTVKGLVEPVLVFLAGVLCQAFSEGLGCWLMVSAVGLGLGHGHYRMRMKAQVRAMRDARIEQRILRDHLSEETDDAG